MSSLNRGFGWWLTACLSFALSGAPARAQEPPAGRAPPAGAVDGFVSDTSLRPLAGATVSVIGSEIQVVTGANGRFRILDLPAGSHYVLVRRLGYEAVTAELRTDAGDTLRASFALARVATALDTVVVAGTQLPQRLSEFEQRRRNHAASASFDRDEILKVNPADTWQMLSRVPSMKFIPYGANGGLLPVSNRGMKIDRGTMQAVPCYMNVMIDGVMIQPSPDAPAFDLSRLPPPGDIHGIEVFAGPGSIPPQYNGAASDKMCGLIAIWTR